LIGGFIIGRFGYLRSIFFATSGAILCITAGLVAPVDYAFLIPLTGFFFSIMFPTLTAAVSDLHPENTGTLLGVLFTFAGLGGMFGPWVIGWASDLSNLQVGFSINLVLTILTFLSIRRLMKGTSNGKDLTLGLALHRTD
jgi:fucose permease